MAVEHRARYCELLVLDSHIYITLSCAAIIHHDDFSVITRLIMDTRHQVHSSEHLPYEPHPGESLVELSRDCLDAAIDYSYHTQHEDGHWCGEVRSNVTATAEYIFLHQALGIDLTSSRDLLCQWLLSQQRDDGSWSLAPGYPGNVSFTVEAYLALKILRISPEDPAMQRARLFVLGAGGVAKVSMLTRINLAILGLFSWDDVPALPVELILVSLIDGSKSLSSRP